MLWTPSRRSRASRKAARFGPLGSIRALTDSTGALFQTYRADAFGVPTATQGASSQPFQFTGEQGDPTGLVYLRARMYDPQSGRFFQRDEETGSIWNPESVHRYVYTGDDPVNFRDPTGNGKAKIVIFALKEVGKVFVKGGEVSIGQAQRIRRLGGNVRVFGGEEARRQVARQIERGAFSDGELLEHGPHRASSVFRPHFKTAGQTGHTFYGFVPAGLTEGSKMLKPFTAEHYTKDWAGPLKYIGTAIDFFNPISDVKEVVDLVLEVIP